MYANNAFSKRRRDGWAARQKYFRRFFEDRPAEAPAKPAPQPSADKPKA